VKHFITIIMGAYLVGLNLTAGAVAMARSTAWPVTNCGSSDALAVVAADKLPALLGKPIQKITLLHYRDQQLSPITVQIDQRDADGRYLLESDTGIETG